MIRYEFRHLDDDTVSQLIALSAQWVQEDCSYGMVVNGWEDLKEPLAVALDGDKIVGYCFGEFYRQQRKSSCIPMDASCFSVDELYTLPQYRGMGVGKTLFRMVEEAVAGQCGYITLTTSTKNYKAILHLYIEELGMDFYCASLIKKTGDTICE